MGKRTALLYLLTVVICAIVFGLLLDWLFSVVQFALPQLKSHVHQHTAETGWFSTTCAIALLLVIGFSYMRSPRKESGLSIDEDSVVKETTPTDPAAIPQRLEFAVSGMTCGHCAETVNRTLRHAPGVRQVEVNLKAGRAVITGANLDPQQLTAAVHSMGYEMNLVSS